MGIKSMIFGCGKSANCYRSNSAPSGVVPLGLASSLFEEGLSKYILEDFNTVLFSRLTHFYGTEISADSTNEADD
jgi:hypothetical protein